MKKVAVLCFIVLLSFAIFVNCNTVASASKIVIFDYYIPFDVYQGEDVVSVYIKYSSENDRINNALKFENFEYLRYGDIVIDRSYYVTEKDGDYLRLTLSEEYLKSLPDGKYYYSAEYKSISIELILYVVTQQVVEKNVVESAEWYFGSDVSFVINSMHPVGTELLRGISMNGEVIDSEHYSSSFFGNHGLISISQSYIRSLPAGTYYFDVDFLSVKGIQLKLTIPDNYFTGDIDGNGEITASDARLVLRASAKLANLDADGCYVADMDRNGKITASDARLILRKAAQLD